jgi:hypothetical protein
VDPKAGVDYVETRKFLTLPGLELHNLHFLIYIHIDAVALGWEVQLRGKRNMVPLFSFLIIC